MVTTRRALPTLCLLGCLISVAAATRAESPSASPGPLPTPGSEAWLPLTFPRVERETRYALTEESPGTEIVLQARADCAASGLILRFAEAIDLRHTPRLRWRWRVAVGPAADDERSKAGDDFAARVYALFEFDRSNATAWQRIRRRLGEAIYGEGLPGKAISYVWAGAASPGEIWTNPYSEDTQMVALRSGPGDGWHTETVDLLADHERLLGAPEPLMAIALMSDSDDTCQESEAYYADFELLPPETDSASPP